MKNVLVLLMMLALIGSASADYASGSPWGIAGNGLNPYGFDTDGNLTDLNEGSGQNSDLWGTWGGDSSGAGSVVVSGGQCTLTTGSYEVAFAHDNALVDLGITPGVDYIELIVSVVSISADNAIIKIEQFPDTASFPNPDNGGGAVVQDIWDPPTNGPDPGITGPGVYSFVTLFEADATAVAVTPVIGVANGTLVIDEIWIGKQGTYSSTKATNPTPKNDAVASTTLAALSWTNPDPNNPADTITSDVYILDAGLAPLTQDPNLGPDVTDSGVVQLANDITDETVAAPALTDDHYYYWAVHCTDSGTGITTQGDVWQFNAGDAIPVADAGDDQFMWLSQDDSALDPAVPQDENVRYFQVVGTYTDDGKSAITDANFVNEGWGWDPDGADDILGNADDQRGVELVSETWDQTPGTVHTSGTVTAVYKTVYTPGDDAQTTDIPGWWTIRLQVTDGVGTGTDVALHRIDVDCATAVAEDPDDNWEGYYDTNNDCVVGLPDFAAFAAQWLDQSVKYE